VLKKGKRFFFEKKKQKFSFTASYGRDGASARRSESFFASFFSKKEALACFQPGGWKMIAVIDWIFRPVSITLLACRSSRRCRRSPPDRPPAEFRSAPRSAAQPLRQAKRAPVTGIESYGEPDFRQPRQDLPHQRAIRALEKMYVQPHSSSR